MSAGKAKSPGHWPSRHALGFEVSLRHQNLAQRHRVFYERFDVRKRRN